MSAMNPFSENYFKTKNSASGLQVYPLNQTQTEVVASNFYSVNDNLYIDLKVSPENTRFTNIKLISLSQNDLDNLERSGFPVELTEATRERLFSSNDITYKVGENLEGIELKLKNIPGQNFKFLVIIFDDIVQLGEVQVLSINKSEIVDKTDRKQTVDLSTSDLSDNVAPLERIESETYTSNLLYSFSSNGTMTGFYAIDAQKMIDENSSFPHLLNVEDNEQFSSFLFKTEMSLLRYDKAEYGHSFDEILTPSAPTRPAPSFSQTQTRPAPSFSQAPTRQAPSLQQPAPTRPAPSFSETPTRQAPSLQQPAPTRQAPSFSQTPTRQAPSFKKPVRQEPSRITGLLVANAINVKFYNFIILDVDIYSDFQAVLKFFFNDISIPIAETKLKELQRVKISGNRRSARQLILELYNGEVPQEFLQDFSKLNLISDADFDELIDNVVRDLSKQIVAANQKTVSNENIGSQYTTPYFSLSNSYQVNLEQRFEQKIKLYSDKPNTFYPLRDGLFFKTISIQNVDTNTKKYINATIKSFSKINQISSIDRFNITSTKGNAVSENGISNKTVCNDSELKADEKLQIQPAPAKLDLTTTSERDIKLFYLESVGDSVSALSFKEADENLEVLLSQGQRVLARLDNYEEFYDSYFYIEGTSV